jgi:hypothetical protein
MAARSKGIIMRGIPPFDDHKNPFFHHHQYQIAMWPGVNLKKHQ